MLRYLGHHNLTTFQLHTSHQLAFVRSARIERSLRFINPSLPLLLDCLLLVFLCSLLSLLLHCLLFLQLKKSLQKQHSTGQKSSSLGRVTLCSRRRAGSLRRQTLLNPAGNLLLVAVPGRRWTFCSDCDGCESRLARRRPTWATCVKIHCTE